MTGFRESEFTSPTGEYDQFMPTAFISRAEADEHFLAYSGSPVAAIAIAPGLESVRCNEINGTRLTTVSQLDTLQSS
jgi:hypothetical protein